MGGFLTLTRTTQMAFRNIVLACVGTPLAQCPTSPTVLAFPPVAAYGRTPT